MTNAANLLSIMKYFSEPTFLNSVAAGFQLPVLQHHCYTTGILLNLGQRVSEVNTDNGHVFQCVY